MGINSKIYAGRIALPKGTTNGIVDVEFGHTFEEIPIVVCSPLYVATTTAVQVCVKTITTSGCTLVYTNNSSTVDYMAGWIAVEI